MGSTAPPSRKSWLGYVAFVGAVAVVAILADLPRMPMSAAIVFAAILGGALFFWTYRLAFAFLGIAAMLALNVLDVKTIVEFAGLDIILFLVAMMVVIGFLEERRFFEHIVDAALPHIGRSGWFLVASLMAMAALSAALVDEVTSILFMAATVFNVTSRLGLKPLPLLMMVVFATNIGSAATVVGNPVGVMIALRAGLGFSDFLRWATPIAVIGLALCILLCLLVFRKYVKELDGALQSKGIQVDEHSRTLHDLRYPGLLFISVVLGLVFHKQTEHLLGLGKNAMLLGTAMIGAGVALAVSKDHARELVERRVDWWTLSFFLILFASVGALQLTGVTSRIAEGVVSAGGDDPRSLFLVFIWVAAVLSALMDNVLAVAMFIPVVEDLGALGMDNFPLWWAMLFAGTFFGNLTMMGSTANIVAIGMLERRGLDKVTFMQWLKPGALIAVPTLAVACALLYIQFYVL